MHDRPTAQFLMKSASQSRWSASQSIGGRILLYFTRASFSLLPFTSGSGQPLFRRALSDRRSQLSLPANHRDFAPIWRFRRHGLVSSAPTPASQSQSVSSRSISHSLLCQLHRPSRNTHFWLCAALQTSRVQDGPSALPRRFAAPFAVRSAPLVQSVSSSE
jgi:hypothetical protein